MNQSKLTVLTVENILSTDGVSVKMQITDSISKNLTKIFYISQVIQYSFICILVKDTFNVYFYTKSYILLKVDWFKKFVFNAYFLRMIPQEMGNEKVLKSPIKTPLTEFPEQEFTSLIY